MAKLSTHYVATRKIDGKGLVVHSRWNGAKVVTYFSWGFATPVATKKALLEYVKQVGLKASEVIIETMLVKV